MRETCCGWRYFVTDRGNRGGIGNARAFFTVGDIRYRQGLLSMYANPERWFRSGGGCGRDADSGDLSGVEGW